MTKSIFSDKYNQLRELLIGTRKSAGLTQTQLAKRLERPQSFVSKFERGERRLDIIEFLDVCAALSLDVHSAIDKLLDSQGTRQ